MFSSLSFPPQLYRGGLNKCDIGAEPLDEGPNGHLVEGYGIVASDGNDDPLPGGDVLVSVSPNPVVSWRP